MVKDPWRAEETCMLGQTTGLISQVLGTAEGFQTRETRVLQARRGWFEGQPGDREINQKAVNTSPDEMIKSEFGVLCSGDRGKRLDLGEKSKKDGLNGKRRQSQLTYL